MGLDPHSESDLATTNAAASPSPHVNVSTSGHLASTGTPASGPRADTIFGKKRVQACTIYSRRVFSPYRVQPSPLQAHSICTSLHLWPMGRGVEAPGCAYSSRHRASGTQSPSPRSMTGAVWDCDEFGRMGYARGRAEESRRCGGLMKETFWDLS